MNVRITTTPADADEVPSYPQRFTFESAVAFIRDGNAAHQQTFLLAFQCLANHPRRVAEMSDAALVMATVQRLIRHGLILAPGTTCPLCPYGEGA